MKKILVIGSGSIGQRHIRSLIKLGEKKIAAYRSGKGSKAELPLDIGTKIKLFSSESVAFSWNPTHVIISNPTSLHLEYIEKCLNKDFSIFVEKPIFADYRDIKNSSLNDRTLKKEKIVVGYCLRFHPLFQKIKEIIESGQFGDIIYAELSVGHYLPYWHPHEDYSNSYAARKTLGGGVLRTLSHEIDLVQFLFGNINQIYSKVDKISQLSIDVDDCVDIIASSYNCSRIIIHMDYLSPELHRDGKIVFSDGQLTYNFVNSTITFKGYKGSNLKTIYLASDDTDAMYVNQMKSFISDDFSLACTAEEAIQILKIIEICEQSSNEGKQYCLI